MSVEQVTKGTFEEAVLKAEGPVLVDFWAAWCNPCRMLSPIVDEIAEETEGLKVYKVNIDDEPELAERFGVMSIPTLIVFKNGEPALTSVGAVPKAKIEGLLKEVL